MSSLRSDILNLRVHIEELTEQLLDMHVQRSTEGRTIWQQATEDATAREGRRGSVQSGPSGAAAGARSASRERNFLSRRGSGGGNGAGLSGGGTYRSTLGGGVMGVY